MAYQLSWTERGLNFQYTGYTSDKEVADAVQVAQGDARFYDLLYIIHEFLKCEGATFSESTVTEIAAIDAAAALSNRGIQRLFIAVVTDRIDVIEMAKAYIDSGIHPHTMRIFSSLDDARAWIKNELKG